MDDPINSADLTSGLFLVPSNMIDTRPSIFMARTMFNVSPNAPADTLELIYGEDSSTGKSSKPTVKKIWTSEQDERLRALVAKHGTIWTTIGEIFGERNGKQCRERWYNHLDPNVNKGDWSLEEDRILFILQKKFGNQWSKMTRKLPGRTDNAIKNRYHAVIRLRLRPSSFFIELDDYNIDEFNLESITKVSNNGLKENTSSDDEYVINSLVHDLKNQHVVHPNPPKKKRSRAEDNENLFLALPNDSNGNSISRVKSTDSNPNSAACTPRLEQSPSNGEYFELLQKGIEAKRERDSTLMNRSKIHQADGEVKDSDYFTTYGSSELPDADKATAQILLGLLQSSNEIMC